MIFSMEKLQPQEAQFCGPVLTHIHCGSGLALLITRKRFRGGVTHHFCPAKLYGYPVVGAVILVPTPTGGANMGILIETEIQDAR
jgi:hypothetical protein